MHATSTQPHKRQGEDFAALDGFRGLLAIFVAIYHTIWLSHPNQWAFFNNGPVIIDLFFAFSGFLMWRLYADTLNTPQQVGAFLKRRFARLYPLHLFMTLVFLAFAVVRVLAHKVGIADITPGEVLPFESGAAEGWASLLQHLTLTQALGLSDTLTYNPPSWTIGAEFCAYLVFAAIMLWAKPERVRDFVLMGVIIAFLYTMLSRVGADMNLTYDYGFWRCSAGFFTGVVTARLHAAFGQTLQRLTFHWASCLEGLIFFGSIAFVIYAGGKTQFFVAPVLALFVLVFAQDRGAVSYVMSHRGFRYLAKISYSVYMTHVIVAIGFAIVLERVFDGLPQDFAGDVWLVIYLAAVIGVSHLTQRYVERPGRRFVLSLGRRQKPLAQLPATL